MHSYFANMAHLAQFAKRLSPSIFFRVSVLAGAGRGGCRTFRFRFDLPGQLDRRTGGVDAVICAWAPPLPGWYVRASVVRARRTVAASAPGCTPRVSCQLNWISSSLIPMASGEASRITTARAIARAARRRGRDTSCLTLADVGTGRQSGEFDAYERSLPIHRPPPRSAGRPSWSRAAKIAGLTSVPRSGPGVAPLAATAGTGLQILSMVRFDKLATLDRSVIAGKLGDAPANWLTAHRAAFFGVFGFGRP